MRILSNRLTASARLISLIVVTSGLFLFADHPNGIDAVVGDLIVTKVADTADGVCDGDCSLREAIIAANSDSGPNAIVVPAGTFLIESGFREDAGQQGDFDIASAITIRGAGALATMVDGNQQDTVFDVLEGATANIESLTVRNGKNQEVESGVGGIRAQGPLILADVRVIENEGGPEGVGGVYAEGDLSIIGAVVSGNSAGASSTGGILALHETTITDSLIVENTAGDGPESVGGASVRGSVSMRDVSIAGNSADGESSVGGLYTTFGEVQLTRVSVSGNSAIGDFSVGGAWHASNVLARDFAIDGNMGGRYGAGGAYVQCCNGAIDLTNASISDNTSLDDSTGGFWNDGEAHLTNVTVSGNSAGTGSTGGIYNSGGSLELIHATIAGNVSGDTEGEAIWNDSELLIMNSIVVGESVSACRLSGGSLQSGGGNFDAGNSCGFDDITDHPATTAALAGLSDNGGFVMTQALLV